jgi:hypothetical protein
LVDDFPLGRLSKTAHFGGKSRLSFFDFAHRGKPISVTEIPESESPFVQRSGALAGHLAEIKRAGRFGSGLWCEKSDRSSEGLL